MVRRFRHVRCLERLVDAPTCGAEGGGTATSIFIGGGEGTVTEISLPSTQITSPPRVPGGTGIVVVAAGGARSGLVSEQNSRAAMSRRCSVVEGRATSYPRSAPGRNSSSWAAATSASSRILQRRPYASFNAQGGVVGRRSARHAPRSRSCGGVRPRVPAIVRDGAKIAGPAAMLERRALTQTPATGSRWSRG